VTENMQSVKPGVNYILNSKRPYPEWLKSHTVFRELSKIDKVFPKIGLPNFKEPCDIMNTAEATTEATRLGTKFIAELNNVSRALYTKLDTELKTNAKERNENCAKMQSLINLINNVVYSLNYQDYAKVVEGRVVLRLRADIFSPENKNPVFRKDEAVLRVINKLWDMLEEFKIPTTKTDQYQEFKDFSRVNVPNKKYTIAFSSSGEEGAWDIGTISMRGVTSCQSWNAPQSRGLIGSIASKFVGVMYLASEQEIPGYGSKMLNRSMVRFAIHKSTKKPALILDRMYPNQNNDTLAAFKKVLKEKSGLDVYTTFDDGYNRSPNIGNDYYIPDEPARKFLKQGEFSYMDYAIPVQQHVPAIKRAPENITMVTDEFKKSVCDDLNKMIKAKREVFSAASKKLEGLKAEYEAAKKEFDKENTKKPEAEREKFEIPEPKLDPELFAFGARNERAFQGIINLFTHCDKKHAAQQAGGAFARLILDSVVVEKPDECSSKEEYHRKFIMTFLKNREQIKEEAKKKLAAGSWMKSFPKAADRFFDSVYVQMRGYVVASCREVIRKTN